MPRFSDFIHIKSRQDLPHLGMIIFLVLGIFLGVYLAMQPQLFIKRAAEGSLVEIKFIPDSIQIKSGRPAEVKLAIDPKNERVTGAEINLSYDPAVITIQEVKNEGFLPVVLKEDDDFKGNLTLVYGSTFGEQPTTPSMLASIKFKTIDGKASEVKIKGSSQISVSSKQGNVLTQFPILALNMAPVEAVEIPQEDLVYPNSLLLEKAFHPSSSPFVRDFREALEPKPSTSPDRIEPELSGAYVKQLGKDIFIEPIVALNEVIQERATEILKPEN